MHCSVPRCSEPVKRQGMCYGHYMKQWRYGTPTPSHTPRWEDLTGQRFGHLVAINHEGSKWRCQCDCGAQTLVRSGCLRRGSTITCGNRAEHWRRQDIKYAAAHDRIRADRGLVQSYACIDCGAHAQHWSYNHTDPDELLAHDISTNPVAYSVDPSHYSPRCIKCHKRFDLANLNATPDRAVA